MFVTALCVTRNRRQWLPKAIECFLKQTHKSLEMLIVSDGEDVTDLIPAEERIRHFHIDGAVDIGTKRNFGCALSRGEVIAHWDDDDYSGPKRISDQVRRLQESGKAVTGYREMRFTDAVRWWLYRGSPDFVLGASLCYRKDWWESHKFPPLQVAEDSAFGRTAWNAQQLDVADTAGDLMYASIHLGNTSPRQLSGSSWQAL